MLPQLYSGPNSEGRVQIEGNVTDFLKVLNPNWFSIYVFYMSKERTIKKVIFWLFVKPPLLTTQKFKLPILFIIVICTIFIYITVSH